MGKQQWHTSIKAELCNLDSRSLYFINSLFQYEIGERTLSLFPKGKATKARDLL